jgi:hypothetical protein
MLDVHREFGGNRSVAPTVTLILGTDKNEVCFQDREIRLRKWDRYAFAQGVVWLAFEDLMRSRQRLTIPKRIVSWVDATGRRRTTQKIARHPARGEPGIAAPEL